MGIKHTKIQSDIHICSNKDCMTPCCKSPDNMTWKKYCHDCLCRLCHENCVVSKKTRKTFNSALVSHIFCENCIDEFACMCDKYN